MISIAICDDTRNDAARAAGLIDEYSSEHGYLDIKCSVFFDAGELLFNIDDEDYDMFLLDIMMPEINGISLGKKIRDSGSDAAIVYMTTSRDYAADAFSVYAFQYLLKPLEQQAFFEMMDSFLKLKHAEAGHSIAVKTADGTENVFFSEISHVECQGHIVVFKLNSGQHVESSHIRIPFLDYIKALLDDGRFVSTHKSYVVNMDSVSRLTTQNFIMADGTMIPVSRRNYQNVKKSYLDHISSRSI